MMDSIIISEITELNITAGNKGSIVHRVHQSDFEKKNFSQGEYPEYSDNISGTPGLWAFLRVRLHVAFLDHFCQ